MQALQAAQRRLKTAEIEQQQKSETDSDDEGEQPTKSTQKTAVEDEDAHVYKAILNRLAAITSRSAARPSVLLASVFLKGTRWCFLAASKLP